ncbi:MAG TPA: hypothetical protein VJZ78_00595 [Anaerolineales bacterium]|nr:hypothetical protein [Anaerolineales bacterium]
MMPIKILFNENDYPVSPIEITTKIHEFGGGYNEVVREIIENSRKLDEKGETFINCASRLLANFKMTRSGPFHGNLEIKLRNIWNEVGESIVEINRSVMNSGLSRDRYILEINEKQLEELTAEIWKISKKILPFSMGKISYGLVGASKILFSVLPEIILPVDNTQWLHLFKTVDVGDVIHVMVNDIMKWEELTGRHLNELDPTKRLTTLPSIYNVMAMNARPITLF